MQTLRCFDIGGTNIAVADVTVNGELHPLDAPLPNHAPAIATCIANG